MHVARRRGCHAFQLRPVLVSATASLRAALRDAVVALVRLLRRGIQREYRPVSVLGIRVIAVGPYALRNARES
jgi:hypothetical protein